MPCYKPLRAWHSKFINPSGKRSMVFSRASAIQPDDPIDLPCGQCIGCRLERSRQWAVRCCHEAQLYKDNCFITLTYNDKYIPIDRSLDVSVFQKFMKRLRFKYGEGIRFFHCGEYGELNGRPHYHACLFNFDFPDKKLWKISNNNRLYVSKSLDELWGFGFCTIGDVTFESAAYVARYIMKKITGDAAEQHYEYIDQTTGEIFQRKPEYTTMSRRPGIGKGFFDQFSTDIFPHDYVVINGKKIRPPKYYDGLLEFTRPYEFDLVKDHREVTAQFHIDNNTKDRLNVREQVQIAKLNLLNRKDV